MPAPLTERPIGPPFASLEEAWQQFSRQFTAAPDAGVGEAQLERLRRAFFAGATAVTMRALERQAVDVDELWGGLSGEVRRDT